MDKLDRRKKHQLLTAEELLNLKKKNASLSSAKYYLNKKSKLEKVRQNEIKKRVEPIYSEESESESDDEPQIVYKTKKSKKSKPKPKPKIVYVSSSSESEQSEQEDFSEEENEPIKQEPIKPTTTPIIIYRELPPKEMVFA